MPNLESEARLNAVYSDIAVRVRRVYAEMRALHGFAMRATEGIRTYERQALLYAQGRTSPGKKVTNSRPGDSVHHFGLAVDSCFYGTDPYLEAHHKGEKLWQEFGRLARAHGLHWGGDWSKPIDIPHVQFTYGLSLDELKALYADGGTASVWTKVDDLRGLHRELILH